MNYDYNSYVNNSVIRNVVNDLVAHPGSVPQVVVDERGRNWKFGTEEYGDVTSLLDRIWCRVVLFFKCLSPTYRTNFNNAIQAINQASQKVQKTAKEIEEVASPILSREDSVESSEEEEKEEEVEEEEIQEEVKPQVAQPVTTSAPASASAPAPAPASAPTPTPAPAPVKTFNLARDLIVTGFAKTDALVSEIKKQTGSVRLANVWARLFGKFGDIVQSYQISKNVITINLKPVQGRQDDEQYRIWIPTSKNEKGVAEPEGGIVVLLGKSIILEAEHKKLVVKGGHKNFVRVPQWIRWLGEFTSADTTSIKEVNEDQIGIAVTKVTLFKNITKERKTNHKKIDHNWNKKGEVINDNRSNQQVIQDHDNDYIAE